MSVRSIGGGPPGTGDRGRPETERTGPELDDDADERAARRATGEVRAAAPGHPRRGVARRTGHQPDGGRRAGERGRVRRRLCADGRDPTTGSGEHRADDDRDRGDDGDEQDRRRPAIVHRPPVAAHDAPRRVIAASGPGPDRRSATTHTSSSDRVTALVAPGAIPASAARAAASSSRPYALAAVAAADWSRPCPSTSTTPPMASDTTTANTGSATANSTVTAPRSSEQRSQ